jgi:hypothetical protein
MVDDAVVEVDRRESESRVMPATHSCCYLPVSLKRNKFLQNVLQQYTIIPELFDNFKSIRSGCFRSRGKISLILYKNLYCGAEEARTRFNTLTKKFGWLDRANVVPRRVACCRIAWNK